MNSFSIPHARVTRVLLDLGVYLVLCVGFAAAAQLNWPWTAGFVRAALVMTAIRFGRWFERKYKA